MIRFVNITLILLMVAGVAVVYDRKYKAEYAAEEVAELASKIEEEREKISLLKAEWSLLRQPSRLQELVKRYNKYLELQPLDALQIVSFDELPAKPLDLSPSDKQQAPLGGGYAGDGKSVVR